MTSSQAKVVRCSQTMVGFSSDKINILQHFKHLFSAIALVPGSLVGMNTGNLNYRVREEIYTFWISSIKFKENGLYTIFH